MQKYKKIFENKDYLIINKPAGLLVHGADHIKEPTLVEQLLDNHPEIIKVGDDPARPGIIHRLDRDVSGLMIICKDQETFDSLKEQFQKRTVEKEYTALVYGKIEKDEGEIDFPIKRSSKGFKMAAVPASFTPSFNSADKPVPLKARARRVRRARLRLTTARQAITEFEVIKKFINYTLLRVKIKTGRTHQIRVHMLAYGHPLVGDNLYSTKKTREKNKKLNLGRVFLVANELSFYGQKGERRTYKINLPSELEGFLKKIK